MPTVSGAMNRAIAVSRWMPSTTAQLSSSSCAMWNDEIGMRSSSDSMRLLCWTSLQMPARRWKSGARSIMPSRSRDSSRSTVVDWVSILMLSGRKGAEIESGASSVPASSAGSSSSTPVGRPSSPTSTGAYSEKSPANSRSSSSSTGRYRWYPLARSPPPVRLLPLSSRPAMTPRRRPRP